MSNDRQQRAARAEQMRKEREKAEKRQRNLITVAIVVVVVALVGVGGFAVKKAADDRATETKVITPKGTTKDYGLLYTPQDAGATAAATKGKTPVNVTLYEDYQCPICKQFESVYGAALDALVKSGDAEIEYRMLNFLDDNGGSTNGYSGRAASAALCVFESDGATEYKKIHDALYAAQPEERTDGPEAPEIIDTFKSAGATMTPALEKCITQERFKPWVVKATDASRKADISGTPTVLVDGKKVESSQGGVPTIEQIQSAIKAAQKS